MPESKLNAVVALKDELSPRLMIMRVVADGWQLPDFKAGQFVVLGLPGSSPRCQLSEPEHVCADPKKLIRRAYSIASSSLTREYMDFYISLVTSGALTPRLFALNIGDHLYLSSKTTGMFTLDQIPEGKHVVMIATGTGLAPYMSMLSSHLKCGSPRRVAVLHGAYHSWDLGYRSELLTLQHLCSNFTYFPSSALRPTNRFPGLAQPDLCKIYGYTAWWPRPGVFNPHRPIPIFFYAVTPI